jgi:hypothetical protein
MLTSSASSGIEAVVGIVIIAKSRKIAEYLFKNEDE